MSWLKILKSLVTNPRMLQMLLYGFSSGLPLLLTLGTLQAWLGDVDVSLKTIGFFVWLRTPYSFKFVWAPFMDRYTLPFLGRRRGWILLTQIFLILSILAMAALNPSSYIWLCALFALLINFFSASQDIAVDAYRREILPDNELGIGTSIFINGYRIGMLAAGSLALILSDHLSWNIVYLIMALLMFVGVLTNLVAPEPQADFKKPDSLILVYKDSFADFFKKNGFKMSIAALVFILLYKLGDQIATNIATSFYQQTGFTNTEIGAVGKLVGFWALILGGLVGGIVMVKIGINKALWIFGIGQVVTILGFAILAKIGNSVPALGLIVGAEYLFGGMGTTAFTAYMMRITNKKYAATQLALLTSFMQLPSTLIAGFAGLMAAKLGWFEFFVSCTIIAIPGMLMLFIVAPWKEQIPCQ